MIVAEKKWKYLAIGLMGILASTGILAIVPSSEAAVPELRGSLLEKILFTIETTHGVVHLDFPNFDISSGGFTIQSVLDEGDAYFGNYKIHVVSEGQTVALHCGADPEATLFVAESGVNEVFEGEYACNGVYLSVEDDNDDIEDSGSAIEGTVSFTKGGFLEIN